MRGQERDMLEIMGEGGGGGVEEVRRRSSGREPVPGVVVSPVHAVQFFGDCNNHTLYCTVTIQVQCTVTLQHYDVSKARREKSLFPSRSPSFPFLPSQSQSIVDAEKGLAIQLVCTAADTNRDDLDLPTVHNLTSTTSTTTVLVWVLCHTEPPSPTVPRLLKMATYSAVLST